MRLTLPLLLALVTLAGCAESRTCDVAELTFAIERQSEVRVSAMLERERADRAEVQLSWWVMLPESVPNSVAVAVSGPGDYYVEARRTADPFELLFQRFDNTDATVTAEVNGVASAPNACVLTLEAVPQ